MGFAHVRPARSDHDLAPGPVWRICQLPESATHSGQMTFSEPVSQPKSGFANWIATKRPLATSPKRPQAVGEENGLHVCFRLNSGPSCEFFPARANGSAQRNSNINVFAEYNTYRNRGHNEKSNTLSM